MSENTLNNCEELIRMIDVILESGKCEHNDMLMCARENICAGMDYLKHDDLDRAGMYMSIAKVLMKHALEVA